MQKFATTGPISVDLDIPAGTIRLVATDRADATVQVLPADASKRRDVKAAEQTQIGFHDGVLRGLVVDYQAASLRIDLDFWIGSMDDERREIYRLGRVTISVGVSMLKPGDDTDSLIDRADACLYAAKRAGRNRVICEVDPEYNAESQSRVA